MAESSSDTYSIDEAVEQMKSHDRVNKYLSVDVDSFGADEMKDLLESVSKIESNDLKLSLTPDEESEFEELLGYVGEALLQQNYGFSEYAICPKEGLNEDDLGSPQSKIILNRLSEDYGRSIAVPDKKLYQL